LSFGDKDFIFEFDDFELLFFDFEAFVSDDFVFFFDDVESELFLFGFVFFEDFVELFGQFVNLGFELDVLFDQALFLVLFREDFR
jgi:hypothetical protein